MDRERDRGHYCHACWGLVHSGPLRADCECCTAVIHRKCLPPSNGNPASSLHPISDKGVVEGVPCVPCHLYREDTVNLCILDCLDGYTTKCRAHSLSTKCYLVLLINSPTTRRVCGAYVFLPCCEGLHIMRHNTSLTDSRQQMLHSRIPLIVRTRDSFSSYNFSLTNQIRNVGY